jgi:hypothetical protein
MLLVRRQNCSVGVCFEHSWDSDAITFDIAPACKNLDGLFSINHRTAGIVKTDPLAMKAHVAAIDVSWGGNFTNFVRLAKHWNNTMTGKVFKSFALELLCCKYAQCIPPVTQMDKLLWIFPGWFKMLFQSLMIDLVPPTNKGRIPCIPLLSRTQRSDPNIKKIVENAWNLSTKAIKYKMSGRTQECIAAWSLVLGNLFAGAHLLYPHKFKQVKQQTRMERSLCTYYPRLGG